MSDPTQSPHVNPDLRILEPSRAREPLLPGRVLVRPSTILPSGISAVTFKSWCQIDLANPTVNQNLNGATVNASSDTQGSFDGVATGTKIIFNLETPISTAVAKAVELMFGQMAGGLSTVLLGSLSCIGDASSYAFGPIASSVLTFGCSVRIRRITSTFVTSTLTWNNVVVAPSITIGTTLNTVSGAGAGAFDFSVGGGATFAGASRSGLSLLVAGPSGLLSAVDTHLTNVYGYIIDVSPSCNGSFGAISLASMSASLNLNQLTNGNRSRLVLPVT